MSMTVPMILLLTRLIGIFKKHKSFDLLLTGYAGAGSYPQCWECYTDNEKLNVYGEKKKTFFDSRLKVYRESAAKILYAIRRNLHSSWKTSNFRKV